MLYQDEYFIPLPRKIIYGEVLCQGLYFDSFPLYCGVIFKDLRPFFKWGKTYYYFLTRGKDKKFMKYDFCGDALILSNFLDYNPPRELLNILSGRVQSIFYSLRISEDDGYRDCIFNFLYKHKRVEDEIFSM